MGWRDAWRTIAPSSDFEVCARATWLLSCFGFSRRSDVEVTLQKVIDEWSVADCWSAPDHDLLPPSAESLIAGFLRALFVETVTILDSSDHRRFDTRSQRSRTAQPVVVLPQAMTAPRVFGSHVADPGAYPGWAFDRTEAVIAMTNRARNSVDPAGHFECVPAGQTTRADWLNPPDFWTKAPPR